MKKQKELNLEVRAIGKPSIKALPAAEQRVFYETILKRIQDLAAEEDKKKAEANNEESTD